MNTLAIQKYEEEIDRLSREVRRLSEQDRQQPSTFYVCTRCGCLYQSVYGCGCAAQAPTLLAENEKLKSGHVVLLEALQAAKREMVGLAAYMETCEPSVIVDNLPSLAKALNLKVDAIEAAIQKAGGI